MTLLTNSYGNTGEIAALVPRYANASKLFDIATRPTLLEVESHCDQISAVINGMLAQEGFAIPLAVADSLLIMDLFVNSEVAAVVEGINGGGRLGPSAKAVAKKGRWAVVQEDVAAYIKSYSKAFELFGEVVTSDIADNVSFRDTDVAGKVTFPIYQRKAFGGEHFTDWDKE